MAGHGCVVGNFVADDGGETSEDVAVVEGGVDEESGITTATGRAAVSVANRRASIVVCIIR